ncbi:12761_t:CDS:2, partial [Racocetra fulgida]
MPCTPFGKSKPLQRKLVVLGDGACGKTSLLNVFTKDNIESKWMEEILEHCQGVKIVLVALKCDLREDLQVVRDMQRYGERPVTYEEGLAVARNIEASRYLECSAMHNR